MVESIESQVAVVATRFYAQTEDGIQPLEAMLYTIERINEDPGILAGVRLGALAFDTCDNPTYALQQAFYFVKGKHARSARGLAI